MAPANPTAAARITKDPNGADIGNRATREHAGVANAPSETIRADLCVIGAGSGGLTVATTAAALGQRVVLIEKHRTGGDGLNTGSVPSKALIAAARRAHVMRTADRFGISPVHPAIDFGAVNDRIKSAVAAVAGKASVERFTGLGVRVLPGVARFIDKATVEAGDVRIRARRFVIATGSSPTVPAIAGLDTVSFFTNETIFDNTRRIDRLIILGGGPVGLEMAQAHLRLGSSVTVLEQDEALSDEDPELAAIALRNLRADGIDIRDRARVHRVETTKDGLRVHIEWNGATTALEGSHLLLAAGRSPNIGDLNLAAAGIKTGVNGIVVNVALKSSNRRVFAIGDVTGATSTHAANHHASVVLKRALFRVRASADDAALPRVTFIDPELAWVGMSEQEARNKHSQIRVLRAAFSDNDRARAEQSLEGHIKVLTDKGGRILAAGVVGPQAGELIQVWALAISQRLNISAMTDLVAPYPTLSEISPQAARQSLTAKASSPPVRWLVRFLSRFG